MNLIQLHTYRKHRLGGIMAILILLQPLLCIGEESDQIIHLFGSREISHWQPILFDAKQRQIGILIGTTNTHNNTGGYVRAYEIVSRAGYLTALQPNGKLGGPSELYFQTADCLGHPNVMADSFVPGYVFTFGKPLKLFVISKHANTEKVHIKSSLSATVDGATCVEENGTKTIYPVEQDEVHKTEFSKTYPGGVTVQMVQLELRQLMMEENLPLTEKKPLFPFKNLHIDEAEMPSFEPPAPQCAPGCEPDFISNGTCEPECNNSSCGYDSGDCTPEEIEEAIEIERMQCAPSCESVDLGDGFCDEMCNNPSCDYDEGDCEDTYDN